MPSLSITPGRKFSITTSALAASCFTTSIALGFLRSSVIERLLELTATHGAASPRFSQSLAREPKRMSSPSRLSTLMTSAPSSAS